MTRRDASNVSAMPRVCQILRVFTRDGEGGNHLGVVNDVTGLDAAGMQAIAADLGFSETVFIDWTDGDVPSVRIFTPEVEMPFAGHPLVGTAHTLLQLGPGGVEKVRCPAGDVSIGVDGAASWIEAALDPANARPVDLADFARRAGIPAPVRTWLVDIPSTYAVLEVADAGGVAAITPNADILSEHFGVLVFARSGDHVRSRFFAPAGGVYEDPATGSAAVAMATANVASGETSGSVVIHQGKEMGHPSRIALSWTPTTARLAGTCDRDEARFLDI